MANKDNNEETHTLAMIFKNWWRLVADFGLKVISYMAVIFFVLGIWKFIELGIGKFIELIMFAIKHVNISVSII